MLTEKDFSDFNDPQLVWEVYGEILDFYDEDDFTAEQVSNEIGLNKKLINRIIHKLVQLGALEYTKKDHWGTKYYRLHEAFKQ